MMKVEGDITNISITNLKALGIFLMVLGHSGHYIQSLQHLIYMFHMPLFFFASGYCFKRKYLEEPFTFLVRRIKGIYYPFVKWSSIFLLFHNVFYRVNIYNDVFGFNGKGSHLHDTHETIEHLVNIIIQMTDNEQLLGGFWFLRSLFWGSIISWVALRICKRPFISSCVIFVICIIMNKFVYNVPILELHTREFASALIIIIGHCFAYYRISTFNISFIIVSFILTFWGSQCYFMEFGHETYSNKIFPEYIVISILVIWSCYSIFERYKRTHLSNVLLLIGNNTLTILTWHFLSFKLVSLTVILIYDLHIKRLAEFPTIEEYSSKGWWVAYLIVGIAIPLTLSFLKSQMLFNIKQ